MYVPLFLLGKQYSTHHPYIFSNILDVAYWFPSNGGCQSWSNPQALAITDFLAMKALLSIIKCVFNSFQNHSPKLTLSLVILSYNVWKRRTSLIPTAVNIQPKRGKIVGYKLHLRFEPLDVWRYCRSPSACCLQFFGES